MEKQTKNQNYQGLVWTLVKNATGIEVNDWETFPNQNEIYSRCSDPSTCEPGIYALGAFDTEEECRGASRFVWLCLEICMDW